jgi:cytochrome b561
MTTSRKRFTAPQRLLHWLMAICILSMLFVGVGMVSTITPKYLTLVQIHKPLGIAILVLALIRLLLRIVYGAPALPADLPEPIKLAANLSQYIFYALDSACASHPACMVVACTLLPGLCFLRIHPDACRSDSLS